MDGPELFHKKNSYIMHPSLGGNYPLSTMTKKGGIIISWNWVQTLSLFEEKKLILALCVEQGLLAAFEGHLYNWNKEVRGQLKGLGVGEDLTRSVARLILLDWDLWQRRASWQLTCTKDMWTTLQMPRRPFLREQGGARGVEELWSEGSAFAAGKTWIQTFVWWLAGGFHWQEAYDFSLSSGWEEAKVWLLHPNWPFSLFLTQIKFSLFVF